VVTRFVGELRAMRAFEGGTVLDGRAGGRRYSGMKLKLSTCGLVGTAVVLRPPPLDAWETGWGQQSLIKPTRRFASLTKGLRRQADAVMSVDAPKYLPMEWVQWSRVGHTFRAVQLLRVFGGSLVWAIFWHAPNSHSGDADVPRCIILRHSLCVDISVSKIVVILMLEWRECHQINLTLSS
jgi:hypothetical protein